MISCPLYFRTLIGTLDFNVIPDSFFIGCIDVEPYITPFKALEDLLSPD